MSQYRYVFLSEWFDIGSSVIKMFNLIYFYDKTIEIVTFTYQYDLKNRKIFIKRSKFQNIQQKDLYIESILTIYSKQFKIVDFANQFTRNKFQQILNYSFILIKPDCYLHIGKIISILQKNFIISNIKMTRLDKQFARNFFHFQNEKKNQIQSLIQHITSDFVVGLQIIGKNCIQKLSLLMGPQNIQQSKKIYPNSIRSIFGSDNIKNCCYYSKSIQLVSKQLKQFFSPKIKSMPIFSNCTLCIIKPHIIQSKQVGQIIDMILMSGFQISAMQWILFDTLTSKQFYQPYKGVLPEVQNLAMHLTIGASLALQIRQQQPVQMFRVLCGPHDPKIAKILKPETIRAKYGLDRVKNAVHCTDLEQDGLLEVNYIFNVMAQN